MKTYMRDFFETFTYPEPARDSLLSAYDKINDCKELQKKFGILLNTYAEDKDCDFQNLLTCMVKISSKAGVHEYTGALLLAICLTKQLKVYYETEKINEQIWYTSMCDLKFKLLECKDVYDIWGTFVAGWFDGFFNVTRFGIHRLQFELVPFHSQAEYTKNGITLKPGDLVIDVHIPRTGTRLNRESVVKSYKEAAVFFRKRYQLEHIAFVCHSWLLYPRNKEVLSPQSNLYSFFSDFDIIESGDDKDYGEVWRLFDKNYEGDVEKLPQDSSLRRTYADWIRKGEKVGWGYGVYIDTL